MKTNNVEQFVGTSQADGSIRYTKADIVPEPVPPTDFQRYQRALLDNVARFYAIPRGDVGSCVGSFDPGAMDERLQRFTTAIDQVADAFSTIANAARQVLAVGIPVFNMWPVYQDKAEREYLKEFGRLPGSRRTKRLRKKRWAIVLAWYITQPIEGADNATHQI